MYRRTVSRSLCFLVLALACGCGRVTVRVNAFLSRDIPFPDPPASIAVFAETQPPNALFEAEVAGQLRVLLEERGYSVAERDSDYVLLCRFDSDGGTTYEDTRYVHEPGRFFTTTYTTGCGDVAYARTYIHGYEYPERYSYTLYQRRVDLLLYRGRLNESTTQPSSQPQTIIWQASAESPGESPDLRRTVPCMLVAVFDYWASDSRHEQVSSVRRDGKKVAGLMEAAGPPPKDADH